MNAISDHSEVTRGTNECSEQSLTKSVKKSPHVLKTSRRGVWMCYLSDIHKLELSCYLLGQKIALQSSTIPERQSELSFEPWSGLEHETELDPIF